ncbi:phospholipid-transporting ATPase ID isoform X1 [Drosophila albomicans]|uniref:P-type phospholipid transporter n=1 Tax=Drosophila albomicans TaxID=7291 RepID=A0A9C6TE49_DROAB|nr:phospholipid-transporting ATPase ID isoform X1 [Drosophila albomicans]XP_051864782.1 phospholipid-transporting ATPase ID isoform X1 [Drosophila albomicans]
MQGVRRESGRQRPDTLELSVLGQNDATKQQQQKQELEQQQQQLPQAMQTAAATRRSRWFHFARKSRSRRRLCGEEEQLQLALEAQTDAEDEETAAATAAAAQQVRLAQPETMNIGNSMLTINTPKTATTTSTNASDNGRDDSFYSLVNASTSAQAAAADNSHSNAPTTVVAVDVEQQYKEQPQLVGKPRLSMLQRWASWRRSAPDSLPSRRRNPSQVDQLEQQQVSASASARNLRRVSQLRRRRSSYYFSDNERRIRANDKDFNSQFKYHNNYIKTSKYSLLTFLPFNLLEQFQRLANFYFLCLLVLQLIPAISSLTPVTTAIPLIGVLTLTAVKDAYDDIQRHLSDSQVNNRKSKTLRNGKLIEAKWSEVQVGDVIRLDNNQFVAADILLLTTSEPNGLCFIETAELDGETNLKAKQCLMETTELGDQHDLLWNFNGEIICERPNNLLNKFEGTLIWKNQRFALDNDKILLRGCVLRNTQWCYGLVVFAGVDTKLMQNSGKTQFKSTGVDRLLNFIIIGIVLFLVSICALFAIGCAVWEGLIGQHFQLYLPWEHIIPQEMVASGATVIGLLVFFSYAIVLNTVVPISLYVSVEVIRFVQSFLINWDEEMYYARTHTYAKARTTTLNEELGQIQYIFSDKTGTLTQNIMTFNKCSINGRTYGDVIDLRTGELIDINDQQAIFQTSSSSNCASSNSNNNSSSAGSSSKPVAVVTPTPPTILVHAAEVHGRRKSAVLVTTAGGTQLASNATQLQGRIAAAEQLLQTVENPLATATQQQQQRKQVHYLSPSRSNSNEDELDDPGGATTTASNSGGRSSRGSGGSLGACFTRGSGARMRRQLSSLSNCSSSGDKVIILHDQQLEQLEQFEQPEQLEQQQHEHEHEQTHQTNRKLRQFHASCSSSATATAIDSGCCAPFRCHNNNSNSRLPTTAAATCNSNRNSSAQQRYLSTHRFATNWSSSHQKVHIVEPIDFSANPHHEADFRWYDRTLLDAVRSDEEHAHNFFRLLALCHTVMAETVDGRLEYQAQSPDEAALVSAARNFGFVFRTRTPNSITIEVMGRLEEYELLHILDFNNVRKRMSVILRRGNSVVLYCKGADNVIYDRLHGGQEDLKARTQDHLNKFAGEGLRTLVLAERRLTEEYYNDWRVRQTEAALSMDSREQKLNAMYEEIESDMQLVGVTAIEDKLQDGVPKSIANLQNAGIKIWVLTGDKQETAINIGYSCQLLTDELVDVFIVDGSSVEEVEKQLRQFKESIKIFDRFRPGGTEAMNQLHSESSMDPMNVTMTQTSAFMQDTNGSPIPQPPPAISVVTFRWDAKIKDNKGGPDSAECNDLFGDAEKSDDGRRTAPSIVVDETTGFALVVNGHSLVHCLSPELESKFLDIASQCKAVICCRVTPLQKALVVELIKRAKNAVTLAIGDGANDVSMIKAAHIGVGISGQEGLQAVLSSDYAIAQFCYLERLLLVHGRWSYYRMCKFLRYFFYKNFAFTLCHCWYSLFCGFSAQTVFDPMFISVYNLFYTSLPVLALGVFEQDVSDKNSVEYPRLYTPGLKSELFNIREFIYSVLHGAFTSLILFLIPYGVYKDGVSHNGYILSDHMTLGAVVATILIVDNTAQIALYTSYWTIVNHVTIWGSLIWYFVLDYFYNYVIGGPYVGSLTQAIKDVSFWVTMLITVVMLMAPVLAYKFYLLDVHPSLSDKIRQKSLKKMHSRVSSDVRRTPSSRRGRRSVRSGYAFAHQEGFGRLITSGKIMHKLPQDFAFPLGLGTKKTQALHNNIGSADGKQAPPGGGPNHHHHPHPHHHHNNSHNHSQGNNINNNNNNNTNLRHNQNNQQQIHSSMADIRGDGRGSGDTRRSSDAGTDDMSPRAPCQDLDTINL